MFFLAASAGLMVLSQAAGIITAYGGASALAVYGTTFIAGSIAIARVGGGWMVDWLTIPSVAASAHAVALVGNVALTLWPGAATSVPALTLVGLGYGVISGLTAAAIAVYWRHALYGRVAGEIYLAWCAAAIILPNAAGRLFDLTQGYGVAIIIAACGNALGILVSLGLPSQRATRVAPPPATRRGLPYTRTQAMSAVRRTSHGHVSSSTIRPAPSRSSSRTRRASSALAGKRIGFVSNEQWQAYRMLPLLKTLLETDFPGIEVLPIDAFPQGNAVIGSEETAALVKASGVDAVIIGNAA